MTLQDDAAREPDGAYIASGVLAMLRAEVNGGEHSPYYDFTVVQGLVWELDRILTQAEQSAARVEALERVVEVVERVREQHAAHLRQWANGAPCDCGYCAALAALDQQEVGSDEPCG